MSALVNGAGRYRKGHTLNTRIGFDLDGTLYNWHKAVYTELLVHEDLPFTYEEFWSKEWKDYRTPLYWDNLCEYKHLVGNQAPQQGLVKMLKEIAKIYDVFYISYRPKAIYCDTNFYMKRHDFPNYERLLFTKNKREVIERTGISIYVEDRIDVADTLYDICKVFLITQPYNVGKEVPYQRLDSILDLKDYLL
jgi:FMN phosphatase YigB (HAD superfamily)